MTLQIEEIAIEEIKPDSKNSRKHNKKNIEAIKGSLISFGQQKPIVINNDNIIIAGNGTYIAARDLGWDKILAIKSNLSKSDLVAYSIADNKTSELAEWDYDILSELITEYKNDFNFTNIGFEQDELLKLIIDNNQINNILDIEANFVDNKNNNENNNENDGIDKKNKKNYDENKNIDNIETNKQQVKTIQLFYNEQDFNNFISSISLIGEIFNTTSPSETILKALEIIVKDYTT